MKYVCVDRGTERCPCVLMEAGQCYTCTMVRDGVCSCQDRGGWAGVCPYTEYLLNGSRIAASPSDRISQFDVLSKISYGGGLHVFRLAVPPGLADKCRRPGAYVMAEALGYRTPVSVLRAERYVPDGGLRSWDRTLPDGGLEGVLELLVKELGPKTMELARSAEKENARWNMAGPYFNGLLNAENLKAGRPVLVIARGTAAAPFVNMMEDLQNAGNDIRLYLDDEALPEDFLEAYLGGQPYERIRLSEEACLNRMAEELECAVRKQEGSEPWNVLLLVSPYFMGRLTEGLDEVQRSRIVAPNPANLCCGMGICGACSHTDKDGITVRLCKCTQTVVK